MKRSKKTKRKTKDRQTDNTANAKTRRPRGSNTGRMTPEAPAFRIERCLRDSVGFAHIEQGCREQFDRMVENYQDWTRRYIHAVRLALLIPGIEDYQPPLDMTTRFWDHIMSFDMRKPQSVLAIALERLDAMEILECLPGGRNFERAELPPYVRRRMRTLDRNKVIEAALTCLDVLVIAEHREGLPIDWKKVKVDWLTKPRMRGGLRDEQ